VLQAATYGTGLTGKCRLPGISWYSNGMERGVGTGTHIVN
jgi:hypothetical protein